MKTHINCPCGEAISAKDEDELVDMLHTSLGLPGPSFIRYPRGAAVGVAVKDTPATLPVGRAEVLHEGADIMIWALGTMVRDALLLAEKQTPAVRRQTARLRQFAEAWDLYLAYREAVQARLVLVGERLAVAAPAAGGANGVELREALQEPFAVDPQGGAGVCHGVHPVCVEAG